MKKIFYIFLLFSISATSQSIYTDNGKAPVNGRLSVFSPVEEPIGPTITSATVSNITTNSGLVSWSASEPITGQLKWEYPGSSLFSTGINYNHLSSHSHTIQNLPDATEVTYYIIGRTVEGDSVAVVPRTFTTLENVSPPVVTTYDYNLKVDFGAIGDGTANDAQATRNALNFLTAGTAIDPDTLYIPNGTYKINRLGADRLTIADKNHWVVIGESIDGVILKLDGIGTLEWGTFFKVFNCDNWKIRNLTIDGNSGPTFFGGANNVPGNESQGIANLLIDASDNWIVEDIVHKNNWYNSIQIRAVDNFVIQRTIGYNTDCQIISYGNCSNGDILYNEFEGHHWSEPIALYRGNMTNLNVKYNYLANKGYAHGIILGGRIQGTINTNVVIEGNVLNRINNGFKVALSTASDVYFNNNLLFVENEGIQLSDCNTCSANNNIVSTNWGGVPTITSGVDYSSITDDPQGGGQDGITTNNGSSISVQNNRILKAGTGSFQPLDINGGTGITNSGNILTTDNTPYIYSMFGTSHTIQNGSVWEDKYVYAIDNQDEITRLTATTGSVNTSVSGNYVLTYNYTDSSGNVATQYTLTITVN